MMTNRGWHWWMILLIVIGWAGGAVGDVVIDAGNLDRLGGGIRRPASVEVLPDGVGLDFTSAGVAVPTEGNLSLEAGTVRVRLRAHDQLGEKKSHALFHMVVPSGPAVAMHVNRGVLLVYFHEDGRQTAGMRWAGSRQWSAGATHDVALSWRSEEGRWALMLQVDGRLVRTTWVARPTQLPQVCYLGARRDKAPWGGALERLELKTTAQTPSELVPGERTVTVKADQVEGRCYNFWRVLNTNTPHEFVRQAFLDDLARRAPYCDTVNCVYMLGGRWVDQETLYKGAINGQVQADFAPMIARLQSILDAGYTPRIVLDNVPFKMSEPPAHNAYGNTEPAGDVRQWRAYVRLALTAMVDAFGRETVERWTFRVGTEPDLYSAHWTGTREQYFEHYDYTVDAVAEVLPDAQVGPGNILNPSPLAGNPSKRPHWGLDIIDHAAEGTNACTGGKGARMDWFTWSWYARIGSSVSDFDEAVKAVRCRLGRYRRLAGTPLVVGEHAVLNDEAGRRLWGGETTEWSASFYAALADRVYANDVQLVYEWNHATADVHHPKGRVIEMLERMVGGDRLAVTVVGGSAARCGAVAAVKEGRIFVLLYNHRMWRAPRVPERVRLVVEGLGEASSRLCLSEWSIDAEHASWAYAYEADLAAAGVKPLPKAGAYEGALGRYVERDGVKVFFANRDKYLAMSQTPKTRDRQAISAVDGRAVIEMDMPGHSVRLLELKHLIANCKLQIVD